MRGDGGFLRVDWAIACEQQVMRARANQPVPFLPKGRHSAFYQTALGHLLRIEDVERVVLTGQVTEQCILYTALDAYLRGYDIVVPPDAVAHIHEDLAHAALRMMEVNMRAELPPAANVF